MEALRIAVIGLKFGRHHVETLANMPGVRLVAIAERSAELPGGLEGYAARYGAKPYRDGVELIAKEQLDAVSLCVSPRTRRDLILAAARRRVAMFVEKPWAPDPARAAELAAICREHQARVMVGFSFRFHPALVRLRDLLDAELGRPLLLAGRYVFGWLPGPGSWLWDPDAGHGFFNENSCHLFDAVCLLLGQPTRVYAETANIRGSPADEIAAVTLRFANGAVASLSIGGLGAKAFDDFPRIDLITEHGQAQLLGRHHTWHELRWALNSDPTTRTLSAAPEQLAGTRYTHAFNHFFQCLREGREPSCGVEDGLRTVAIAHAIAQSASLRRPVEIPPDNFASTGAKP